MSRRQKSRFLISTWKRVVTELYLWNAYLEVIKYRDIKRDIKAHPRKKYHDDVKVVTPIVTWKRTFIPLEVRTSVEGGARDLVEKGGRGRCDRSRATMRRNRKRDGISGNPARVYLCPRVCSPFYSPEMQRKKWGGMQETTWKKLATLFKLGQFSS